MAGLIFNGFEIELQNTLYNLYDPAYQPAESVFAVCGTAPESGLDALRTRIIEAVEEMNQGGTLPETARAAVLYRVLRKRFIESLSQERAAEGLGMSARHLRRKQNEAVHALALRLWNRWEGASGETGYGSLGAETGQETNAQSPETAGSHRLEAILHEIEVLNENAPGAAADLRQSLQRAAEMSGRLHRAGLVEAAGAAEEPARPVEVDIHPTVLRQLIMAVIEQVAQAGLQGSIQICVEDPAGETETAVLAFRFTLAAGAAGDALSAARRFEVLVQALGGRVEIEREVDDGEGGEGGPGEGGPVLLRLVFPRSRKTRVLVVDDNAEIAHLYRRFASGTHYEITHLPSGTDLLSRTGELRPDVLVIDILLPGVDGWDLLQQLKHDPATRAIPVLVCSALGSADIARSLGAAGYLPKPVDRRAFIQALERAVQSQNG